MSFCIVLEKEIAEAIVKGIEEAKGKNIKGKDVTPFILNQVSKITDGKSLQSSILLFRFSLADFQM
jgi:pseudouridine-5'-phosphate glycosidase